MKLPFNLIVGILLTCLAIQLPAFPCRATDRPNILWLTAEDMSPTLGCFGDRNADTPHLDAFAKQSVIYTNAFATAPVCSPSRSCLITGIYATSMGTQRLRSEFPVPKSIRGFPALLRQAGYFTSNNVKTDYNTSSESRLIEESWVANGAKAHWRDREGQEPFFSVFNDMTTHQSRTMTWTFEHFQRDIQSQLQPSRQHDPASMAVPPYYPDTPLVRRTLARFYDCVSVMDQNVGKRLKQLEDDGLADNTIVFFYSDHGSGLPRHKRLLLDSGMHVPLMIRFPKRYQHLAPAKAGERVDRLVSFVDFAPTVVSLVGIKPPESMQGTAFLGSYAGPQRDDVFGARDRVDEAYDLSRSIRDKRYLYVRNFKPHLSYNQPSAYSDLGEMRDEITALAKAGTLSEIQMQYAGPARAIEELYDTKLDPQNIHNLVGSTEHRAILNRMRNTLRARSLKTRDLGFLPEITAWRVCGRQTPYEFANQSADFDLQAIYQAADLVGRSGVLGKLAKQLSHSNPAIRYWSVVGLRNIDSGEQGEISLQRLRSILSRALDDSAAEVRIEAASGLLDFSQDSRAIRTLVDSLGSENETEVLAAARALQLAGEKARQVIPAIKSARIKAQSNPTPVNLFVDFATTMHLVELGELDEDSVFMSFR